MNKSIFMGRLVRDPEIRYTQTDKGEIAVASFRIAVDRKFVKRDGVTADYFSCSAFGRLAEFVEKYLFQGIKVVVTGRLENDNYKNRDGDQVYGVRLLAEDIEFAESKKAMEDRMNEEADEREGRSSGRSAERGGTERSGRSNASARERDSENGRRSGDSRRSGRQSDTYEDDRERETDSGRRGRSSSSRSSGSGTSRRGQGGKRSVDEEYMDAPDEEMDFD